MTKPHDPPPAGPAALASSGARFADVTCVCGTLAQHVGTEPEAEEHGPHRLVFLVPAAAPRPGGLAAAADDLAGEGLSVRGEDRGPQGQPGPWEVVVVDTATGQERPATGLDFRHGAAVHQLRAGVPLSEVSQQLGHARVDTTTVSTKLTDRARRAYADRVAW